MLRPQSYTVIPSLINTSFNTSFKAFPDNLESIPIATLIASLSLFLAFSHFEKPYPINDTISDVKFFLCSFVSIAIPLISVPFFKFFNVAFISFSTLDKFLLIVPSLYYY